MASDESVGGVQFNARMSFASGNVAEQWRLFKRQLLFYFDGKFSATQLTDRRKVGLLMTALGRDGIDILDTFFEPTAQPTFEQIVAKFDAYCKPKKNTVFERSVYFRLAQKPDQPVDLFVVELRKQAALCEFAKEELPKLLRDMLVIGLRDAKLREELLRDPELDLDKAIAACKARERSTDEASQMAAYTTAPVAIDQVFAKRRLPPPDPTIPPCPSCSYKHGTLRPCPALKASCKKCGQAGHFIKVCPKKSSSRATVKAVEQQEPVPEEPHVDLLKIYGCRQVVAVDTESQRAWYVMIMLGNANVKFKLDTAAECDTLCERSYKQLVPRPPLLPSKVAIKPYHAPPFRPLGKIVVWVQSQRLEFLIMPDDEENLLGFKTCVQLGLIKRVSAVTHTGVTREAFVASNSDLFQGVGLIPKPNKLYVDSTIHPTTVRPRRFAYALLPRLVKTLKEMLRQDIIAPVEEPTPWVSNITIVEKADGTLRVCLDPQNLNKALLIPKYVIPKADDILVNLTNKKLFTVVDLKSGFWHMPLDDESSKLTTFNSPLGRFRFKRLCFGINCAPEMFMAEMVRIFGDIQNVFPYFDDLIVATETEAEHDATLAQLCQRAREYNVKFNSEKFQFKQTTVQFLGLVISESGVEPAPKHVRAMLELPTPVDKPAVLRFLGLVKFLARFVPNVSQLTANLRHLTKREVDFEWTANHENEFQHLKKLIASKPVLTFFDVHKAIVIQTDSSKDGLGSVLLQEDQPVAFASRALTPAEVRYSQIEKELLAIVFAVERFHDYVYGLPVLVHSDHRPLESILRKNLDKVSPRLQRLRLRLLKYNVTVCYKPGSQLVIADALSRAYLTDEIPDLGYQNVTVHTVTSLAVSTEKAAWIAAATAADPILQHVQRWVETDEWPAATSSVPPGQSSYLSLQSALSLKEGVLFFENRLIVPSELRPFFLQKLHEGHLGTEKTKRLARETVYWPGMTVDIVNFVQSCEICQKFARNNTKQPLQSYPIASYPWQQLAIDIATLQNKDYLIIVDKFSNWPEVLPLSSKSASEVVTHLRRCFANYGIPEVVISDNNPFNSATYLAFAEEWGFKAIFTSPHYPQANGHAERTVQTVKTMLRKSLAEGASFHYALLQYRNAPITDTGFSPAQVLIGRRLRTKLPVASQLLKPHEIPQASVIENKAKSQADQQSRYNQTAADLPPLEPHQKVWVKDDCAEKQWQPATVKDRGPTPRSFIVEKEGGGSVVRNRRFLRPRETIVRPARYRD